MEESTKDEIKDEIIKKIKKEIKDDNDSPGALFIPAGVLGGIGFGFLYENLTAGLFIGLGVGFALFALYEIYDRHKKKRD